MVDVFSKIKEEILEIIQIYKTYKEQKLDYINSDKRSASAIKEIDSYVGYLEEKLTNDKFSENLDDFSEKYYTFVEKCRAYNKNANEGAYYYSRSYLSQISFNIFDLKSHIENIKNLKKDFPGVITYKENSIKNSHLQTTPTDIKNSEFFKTLFKILDKNLSELKDSYSKASKQKTSAFYNKIAEEYNILIKEKINKRFNRLYFGNTDDEVYNFKLNLEEAKIFLEIYKNKEAISLEEQSLGFRKFFNLFFNFLYLDDVKSGSIVIMDEIETNLSVLAQKDLRKFLKDFGERNKILFIVSTHSPFMLDIHYLDEVRIVKKHKDGLFSEILNDFSAIYSNEADTLKEIKISLQANYFMINENLEDKVVFVEGITDYNYLTAFKLLYEKTKKEKPNVVFLPIGGLGKPDLKDDENPVISDEQKMVLQNLADMKKQIRQDKVILLADADKSGVAIKNEFENLDSRLSIILLNEAFEKDNIKEIENLFSKEEIIKFSLDKKSSIKSGEFKNKIFDLEIYQETKDNFFKLLKYIQAL